MNSVQKQRAAAAQKRYHAKNPGLAPAWAKVFKEKNPNYQKEWCDKNRTALNERGAAYRAAFPEKSREASRRWKEKNKEARAAYIKEKRHTCTFTKISSAARSRIGDALRSANARKSSSSTALLGCTIPELRDHLAAQFREGMTWENHGEWHIDHIRPCSSFDLLDPAQQSECFNYKNLQPLWAAENLKKSGPRRSMARCFIRILPP